MATRRLVVGLDGSTGAHQALAWCANFAGALDAEVVAVNAIDIPAMAAAPLAMTTPALVTDELVEELHEALEDWCELLRDADVPYRVEVFEGTAATAINAVAERENADLIVVGRRSHGALHEFVLGSVPHALAHSGNRPLVIVPPPAS
jgi:nucleotide-binding universal stress UspA family protein